MAFTKLPFLLPLILASLLFYFSSDALSTVESHALVDNICNQTQNSEFCVVNLGNYPETGAADMNELAVISVILASEQARLNRFLVDDLLHKEQDPATRDLLAHCLQDYLIVLGNLQTAYMLSEIKDYRGVAIMVNEAMKMTNMCEAGFQESPNHSSPMSDMTQKMVWLNDIALVILDELDG